jgi:dTDP-glucose 4,6-dehydratase
MISRRILVTGGSGFIGSNFIRYYYHAHPDTQIVNLDALTYAGNPENLKDIEALESAKSPEDRRYIFVQGDICDESLLRKLFTKYNFSIIFNFAAESHVDRSIMSAFDFIRSNIEGVRALIDVSREYHIPRFVHISTDEVYGSVTEGFSSEDAPFRPSSPYSASKASADLLVQAWMRTHRLPAIIVRGSNNYGPYQYPEKLIPLVITNLIENKKIPVHGTGSQVRSWIHVADFCAAIALAAEKAPDFGIYNVSGELRANMEIIEAIAKRLGKDTANFKEHIGDRPGGDFRYAPDSFKIESEFGWQRKYSLEQVLDDVIGWYIQNRPWWEKIKSREVYSAYYDKQSKAQYY